MDTEKKGIILALLTVVLWSQLGAGIRILAQRIDSFTLTLWIGLFATIVIGIYLFAAGKAQRIISEFKKGPSFFIIAGVIGLGIQQILYLKAYELAPAADVITVFYLYPLFMVIVSSLFFKEKTLIRSYLFTAIGFIGVYIMLTGGRLAVPKLGIATVFTILAAISWAIFSSMIKERKFDVEIGMFLFNLFGFISLLLCIPFLGTGMKMLELYPKEALGIFYLALVPTAISFVLWNKALKTTRITVSSSIAMLTPFFTIAYAVILLKEQVTFWQMIGLVLIVGSVLLNVFFGKGKKNKYVKKA